MLTDRGHVEMCSQEEAGVLFPRDFDKVLLKRLLTMQAQAVLHLGEIIVVLEAACVARIGEPRRTSALALRKPLLTRVAPEANQDTTHNDHVEGAVDAATAPCKVCVDAGVACEDGAVCVPLRFEVLLADECRHPLAVLAGHDWRQCGIDDLRVENPGCPSVKRATR